MLFERRTPLAYRIFEKKSFGILFWTVFWFIFKFSGLFSIGLAHTWKTNELGLQWLNVFKLRQVCNLNKTASISRQSPEHSGCPFIHIE